MHIVISLVLSHSVRCELEYVIYCVDWMENEWMKRKKEERVFLREWDNPSLNKRFLNVDSRQSKCQDFFHEIISDFSMTMMI